MPFHSERAFPALLKIPSLLCLVTAVPTSTELGNTQDLVKRHNLYICIQVSFGLTHCGLASLLEMCGVPIAYGLRAQMGVSREHQSRLYSHKWHYIREPIYVHCTMKLVTHH